MRDTPNLPRTVGQPGGRRLWIAVLAVVLVSSVLLSGCPARQAGGSPVDLDPTFLDRA